MSSIPIPIDVRRKGLWGRVVQTATKNGNGSGALKIVGMVVALITLILIAGAMLLNVGIQWGEKNEREKQMLDRIGALENQLKSDEKLILATDKDRQDAVDERKAQQHVSIPHRRTSQ